MHRFRTVAAVGGLAIATGLAAYAFVDNGSWPACLASRVAAPAPTDEPDHDHGHSHGHSHDHDHDHAPPEQVKLSPQAQANLRITSQPLRRQTYWQTIQLPGQIVDRPGHSDHGVVAPAAGIVTQVHHFPGDTVPPGDALFTIRLLSEAIHLAQAELLKTASDVEIAREMRARLGKLADGGSIAQMEVIQLDHQLRRLAAAERAHRLDLQARGLTPAQIDGIAAGELVTEITVTAPRHHVTDEPARDEGTQPPDASGELCEIQELRVELGQQVAAGQMLCLLSHHEALFIEGRGFLQEISLLERAVSDRWPVEVEFMDDDAGQWPDVSPTFTIRHIANTIDPASRTFAFYLPLQNQSKSYVEEGRTRLLWRFRPGQRVRLHVRTEKLDDVFVLPADAVMREGAETYVFRRRGDAFERKAVRLLHHDRRHAVLAADGSVLAGAYVAQGSAAQLNRALKAASGIAQAGVHMHADGTVHDH